MDVNPTHVNRWLDHIGASEEKRQLFWDISRIKDISLSVISRITTSNETSVYFFGSASEGTTIDFIQSDEDTLICHESHPVINTVNNATAGECYLMARDCSTKPGYVKLHKVVDGVTQNYPEHPVNVKYEKDDDDIICLRHFSFFMNQGLSERHGPADTYRASVEAAGVFNTDIDYVYALRCKHVPCFANSWIRRLRQYDWPSQKQLEKMSSFGCFLVGVSHPKSQEKQQSIEWRISFSLQERELMTSLNPTQHKCYVLLKLIKNELIEPCTGKSISSYHCKTCLFYTIESSRGSLWTEENIIECLHRCLNFLSRWSKNGNCPNYFIPEENMFDKIDGPTLQKIHTKLECLLREGTAIFNCLPYYSESYNYGTIYEQIRDKCNRRIVNQTPKIYLFRNSLLKSCKNLDCLQSLLRQLEQTDQVTEHTPTDVRLVLSYIIPHICLQITHGLASFETTTRDTFGLLPLNSLHNIMLSSVCDLISSRLSLAAILLYVGMFNACWHNLKAAEDSLTPYTISVCRCDSKIIQCAIPVVTKTISIKDIIEQYTAGCMVYLPQHANFVHPGLQFEMYRSVYMNDGSIGDMSNFWFDWIVVDSKVYLYFLHYILCIKANKKPVWKRSFVEKLRHVIEEDKAIGHRETAYNLLGWILVQENKIQEAWQCFCRSWRIRPHHNAAKWHLILHINDLLR